MEPGFLSPQTVAVSNMKNFKVNKLGLGSSGKNAFEVEDSNALIINNSAIVLDATNAENSALFINDSTQFYTPSQ